MKSITLCRGICELHSSLNWTLLGLKITQKTLEVMLKFDQTQEKKIVNSKNLTSLRISHFVTFLYGSCLTCRCSKFSHFATIIYLIFKSHIPYNMKRAFGYINNPFSPSTLNLKRFSVEDKKNINPI